MKRVFATVTENEDSTIDLNFITITNKDLENPANLGVDAEYIMMVQHLGYDNVMEYYEDVFDPDDEDEEIDVDSIEEEIECDYTDSDYSYRTFKEYIPEEN